MEFGRFKVPEAVERELAMKVLDRWIPIDNYKAIVDENGRVYAVVSKNYKLVRHKEVVDATNKVLKEFNIEPIYTTIDLSFDKAVMFYKVLIDEIKIRNETIQFGLMTTNSYDLSIGINVLGFGMNMECMNEMVLGREILRVKKRHLESSVGLELEKFKKAVEEILDKLLQIRDIIEASMDKKVSFSEVLDLVLGLNLSLKNTRKVLRLIQKYTNYNTDEIARAISEKKDKEELVKKLGEMPIGTRWQVYNALTDFLTHHLRTKDLSKKLEMFNKAAKILIAR